MLFGPTIGNGEINGVIFHVNPLAAIVSVVNTVMSPTHAVDGVGNNA